MARNNWSQWKRSAARCGVVTGLRRGVPGCNLRAAVCFKNWTLSRLKVATMSAPRHPYPCRRARSGGDQWCSALARRPGINSLMRHDGIHPDEEKRGESDEVD